MQLFCPAPLLGDTQGSPLSAPFTPGERLEESLSSNTVFLHGCNWERAVRSHPSSHSNASYGVLCPQHISSGWKQLYLYVSASFVPPPPPIPPIPHPKTKTETERNHCAPLLLWSITLLWPKNTTGEGKAIVCPPSPPTPQSMGQSPAPSAAVLFVW